MSYLDEIFRLGQALNSPERNNSPERTNKRLDTPEMTVKDERIPSLNTPINDCHPYIPLSKHSIKRPA